MSKRKSTASKPEVSKGQESGLENKKVGCAQKVQLEMYERDHDSKHALLAETIADNNENGDAGTADGETVVMGLYTKKPRLQFLDVLRGLTIAWMILVDNAGYSWPMVDHCPWDGIALADFVMPNFDFIIGVSCTLSLKKFVAKSRHDPAQRWSATWKICIRTFKLFVLGIATQCGVSLFQYDLAKLRIMGILQRVACCYFVAAMFEVWLPAPSASDTDSSSSGAGMGEGASWAINGHGHTAMRLLSDYRNQWAGVLVLLAAHTAILYGVDVPPWVEHGTGPHANESITHACGRGILTPACNAAKYVDRHIFGVDHMYFPANGGGDGRDVTYQRLAPCTTCPPGKCGDWAKGVGYDSKDLSQKPPAWCCTDNGNTGPCDIPFDPEGFVSTLTCVVASVIGAHYGHVLTAVQSHGLRLVQWLMTSCVLVLLGIIMHFSYEHCTEGWHGMCTGGVPWNTDLYSISFLFFTSGVSGLLLCFFYVVNDVYAWPTAVTATQPFRWLGLNAITIYVLAEGGVPEWLLGMFYLHSDPDASLANVLWPTGVYWGFDEDTDWTTRVTAACDSDRRRAVAVLVWVLAYIGFWMAVAALLHKRGIYLKI